MSDRNAPLLPHELDAIQDEHLRARVLASLEATREEVERLKEELEDRIEKARDAGKEEAEAEWTEKYEGVWKLVEERREEAKAALQDRDDLLRALSMFMVDGLVNSNRKALKAGLYMLAEQLQAAELMGPVEAAEAKGAADFLEKAIPKS